MSTKNPHVRNSGGKKGYQTHKRFKRGKNRDVQSDPSFKPSKPTMTQATVIK